MLSNALHSHLDEMDALIKELQDDIDKIIISIDRKLLIQQPEMAIMEITQTINTLIDNRYIERASKLGLDLSKLLKRYDKEGKEILFDPSKDPTKNKEILQNANGQE
jgi:hypothetical protein